MSVSHIGIDVSKASLDCHLLLPVGKGKHRKFDNGPAGFRDLLTWVGKHTVLEGCRFCMESTGCYSFGIAAFLADAGHWVSVQNPRRIKHFAIAANLKVKTDKVDAYCIARFSQTMNPAQWTLKDPVKRELAMMRTRLGQLAKALHAEKGRLENPHLNPFIKDQILAHCESLQEQIRLAQEHVRELMGQHKQARVIYHAVTGLKGIGPECGLLMATFDIHSFEDARDVPAFFGLNPVLHQSGKFCGQTQISKQGDAHGRATLMSAANAACRFNDVFRAFYQKLLDKGLKKKQAKAAVARKLAMTAWAIARNALLGNPIFYPGGQYRGRALRIFSAAP